MPVTGSSLPARSGGAPMFPEGLPLTRVRFSDPSRIARDIERVVSSGILTDGPTVRRLEERAAEYLRVRHCVAVASCTTGLMLLLRAAELSGDVVVPSFSFAATAHAVMWNGLRPVFADIDPETLTLSPVAAEAAIGVRVSAILATHVYGTPSDVEGLGKVSESNGIALFFDAAHGFGARHGMARVGGFGAAEVFSLTPTKTLVAGEGGLIATNDDLLAERCRLGRNYGHPGDYDCRFVGLNGRMSELHAVVALASIEDLEERIVRRNELARSYRSMFREIPGIDFPVVPEGDLSTYKDLTILVREEAFGLSADALAEALDAEGVETRRYFSPPIHRMRAYRSIAADVRLPITDEAAAAVLSLPISTDLTDAHIERLAEAIRRIRRYNTKAPDQDPAGPSEAGASGQPGAERPVEPMAIP